ncbi:MAG: TonB family protein [Mariprofundaceae bacterium]|nr:TonB family protein [Mariprofundaceae bacterium]
MKADAPSIPATGRLLIWLIAMFLAMGVHIALVAAVEWVQTHETAQKDPPPPPLEVFLVTPKQVEKLPQPIMKPKPVVAPVIAAKPPVTVIAKVEKKVRPTPSKPKRTVKPKTPPKAAVTEVVTVTPQPINTPTAPQPIATPIVAAAVTPPPAPVVDVAALKHDYMRRALALIEQQKHYPRSARRRHMEGDVLVELDVDSTGHACNIHLSGAHAALQKATKTAIADAMPLQLPPEKLTLPLHLRFVMQYRLDS